mgnify:FL=1
MNGKTVNTLEDILQICFGCKKPFNKNGDQTSTGVKAYEKLIAAIYGLENIGVIDSAHNVIKQLDVIASGEYC